MKAKLTRADGTVVELEGDEKDVTAALLTLLPVQFQLQPFPYTPPHPYIDPYPYPTWTTDSITCDNTGPKKP